MRVGRYEVRYAFTKVEPRDIWVGLFWDRNHPEHRTDGTVDRTWNIYICLVPLIVTLFWVTKYGSADRESTDSP